mmetsp:Transcript_1491/g.1960  ORF Transcript_1491/g.1960 Transcript_1491/m.1960 type:complete len:124 (-) Transcript_1491:6-377(-)
MKFFPFWILFLISKFILMKQLLKILIGITVATLESLKLLLLLILGTMSQTMVFFLRGNHGYDNMEDDMQAIFVAKGPHFRQGTTPTLENINVYQMICDILGIKAAPNNATMTSEEIAALYLKK